MEKFNDLDLEKFLETNKIYLTDEQVISLAFEICSTLYYLSKNCYDDNKLIIICHRDLKPANIIINQ